MGLRFYKYQGTGNDFVLLDHREDGDRMLPPERIQGLCDRHFGVGGDGVILLLPDPEWDMYMRFYNPDGSKSFCGNGSRCAIKAFFELRSEEGAEGRLRFGAIDGVHEGELLGDGRVEVSIGDVERVLDREDHSFVDTGSPHVILPRERIDPIDIEEEAAWVRERSAYYREGTNVDLVHAPEKGYVHIRTHERGVEAETLSCGSGVTAAALWAAKKGWAEDRCMVSTAGGELEVRFNPSPEAFRDIRLIGPAEKVFSGWTP
ncbi:MAG: diaminopimelate epimerase [Flavobacteriales bacterium]